MADTNYWDDEIATLEGSLLDALRATAQGEALSPPIASPTQLPSDELSPPMFERLVAEVALRVDGLNSIRIYGRSGQDQGGLDLIGWRSEGLSVYQVRRVDSLSPAGLRAAVEDFAVPTKRDGSKEERRFDARRFVLVTGCVVSDRHVDDELAALKTEYAGDLEIELYDNTQLSIILRDRGPLVYGIFGPHWAQAYCGYQPPIGAPTPHGRAYLGDPVDILGYSEVHDQAQALATSEPSAAAELFRELAALLNAAGFIPRARAMQAGQLSAHRSAGQTNEALAVGVDLALAAYEDGNLMPGVGSFASLADLAGAGMEPLLRTLEALAGWFEHGYTLGPVIEDLSTLLATDAPRATTLLLAVAEQIIADDDPTDDPHNLLELLDRWLPHLKGLENVRLACCAADLRVRLNVAPDEAFRQVTRLALGGHISVDQAALVHRRRGRAFAAINSDEAVESYRRAVLDASECGLGGDVRDALRSIAFLTEGPGGDQPMEAARSVADRRRLIDGVDRVVITALEALSDDKLPQALRSCHDWVRRERINGALMDEIVALRRYGSVFTRASEHVAAVRALVRGGAKKAARKAAIEAGPTYVDVTSYLEARQLTIVRGAAAASLVSQADRVPDEDVDAVCGTLLGLADCIGTEQLFHAQASIDALEALAAFDGRLPDPVTRALLDKLTSLVERTPGRCRHSDQAMLALFEACAHHNSPEVAERAVTELVRSCAQDIHKAERNMRRIGQSAKAVELLQPLAADGNRLALELLATWGVVTDSVRRDALEVAHRLLARPIGHPRSSWTAGEGVQESAIKLRAILRGDPNLDNAIAELRDRLLGHLLQWAEDGFDVSESRSGAVNAVRILADVLPEAERESAFDRMIDLHDDPRLNDVDQRNQDSLHPFSRFRFDTGSENFHLECLFAAAVLARTTDQWERAWRRVVDGVSNSRLNETGAANLGRAARCLNEIKAVDVKVLMGHRLPALRQAAVVCWAVDGARDPGCASVFTADDDMVVRANLAHALRKISAGGELYRAIREQLKHDPSWQVRSAALAEVQGGSLST